MIGCRGGKAVYYFLNINNSETDIILAKEKDADGKDKLVSKKKTARFAFKDKLYNKGVGTLVIPEKGWGTSRTKPSKGKNFYPSYNNSAVITLVNKLLAPYKAGTKTDTKTGMSVLDVEKVKKQTVLDTLSKDQIVQRAKYTKQLIDKKIKQKSAVYGTKPSTVEYPDIEDINFYKGAWTDKNGIGFVYFETEMGIITRIYPTGKAVRINKKTGKEIKSGTWKIKWVSSKQRSSDNWYIHFV
jgi:hypothetical protein